VLRSRSLSEIGQQAGLLALTTLLLTFGSVRPGTITARKPPV
jgi:hypothetical protein